MITYIILLKKKSESFNGLLQVVSAQQSQKPIGGGTLSAPQLEWG